MLNNSTYLGSGIKLVNPTISRPDSEMPVNREIPVNREMPAIRQLQLITGTAILSESIA